MRKKVLSAILILTWAFGTCSIALAADTEDAVTAKGLRSHGRIAYQNGDDLVIIDSKDLYKLAEKLDSFKSGVADRLRVIGTYFTRGDGIALKTDENMHVVHTRPSDGELVDPEELGFDTLLEGIAASQSVPPELAAASADNLSAGTAAWVNGELLLGTGADNQSFYERGYEEGYTGVSSQVTSIDFIRQGGDLRVKDGEHSYLGPCDLHIPNKDVWVLLAGSIAPKAEISPAPSVRLDNQCLSMLCYPRDPDLSDTATRTLHVAASGNRSSGVAAPWYLLYLK